jgi:hypothetical protein
MKMNLDNHPIIKNRIPFIVKHILAKTSPPQNEEELIEFAQEIGKLIIKETEPVSKN